MNEKNSNGLKTPITFWFLRSMNIPIACTIVNGTVNVPRDAAATFHAGMNGTLNVSQGGVARIAPTGVSLGMKHIDGTLINEGVRDVQVSGSGPVEDRPGSTVREPDEVRPDGGVIYRGN